MSTNVENQIVRMEFDNAQFERGARETLDTLDDLNTALQFKEINKRFGELSSLSASMSDKVSSISDTIKREFSVVQKVVNQTLNNVVNKIEAFAKTAADKLNIFQGGVAAGFAEYETQINAVQTIWANTKDAGTTMDEINDALDELNVYADKTIYNFTEMTRNIGTFTAAGVDLETSVKSIQGIANLAAMSGSTSQQASTAMYQLSQAIAAGTVQLQDWNSVVNAGMGGKTFQNVLIQTAKEMGTIADETAKGLEDGSKTFRETLTKEGWLTTEVLTTSLAKFTDTTTELGRTATDAATKVKTFSQLLDTLKETVQSGWTQTWEYIIGDFEQVRDLFTKISNAVTDLVQPSIDARNKMLEYWSQNGILGEKMSEEVEKEGEYSEEIQKVAKRVIQGEFGNGQARFDLLERMGYDYRVVQNCVNELLGMEKVFEVEEENAKNVEGTNKQLTGREMVLKGLKNIAESLVSVFKHVKAAFEQVFPPMTGFKLTLLSEKFMEFTEKLKPSRETLQTIQILFRGLFSIIKIAGKSVGAVLSGLADGISKAFSKIGSDTGLGQILRDFGNFFWNLSNDFDKNGTYDKITENVSKVVESIIEGIAFIIDSIVNFSFENVDLSKITDTVIGWLDTAFDAIDDADIPDGLKNVLETIIGWLKDVLEGAKDLEIPDKLSGAITTVIDWVKDFIADIKDFKMPDGVSKVFDFISGVIDKIFEFLKNTFPLITGIFTGLGETGIAGLSLLEKVLILVEKFVDLMITIVDKLIEIIDNVDASKVTWDDMMKLTEFALAVVKVIAAINNIFKGWSVVNKVNSTLDSVKNSVNGTFNTFREMMYGIMALYGIGPEAAASEKRAYKLEMFKLIFKIILELIVMIGLISYVGMENAIVAFAGVIATLITAMVVLNKLDKEFDKPDKVQRVTQVLKAFKSIISSMSMLMFSLVAMVGIMKLWGNTDDAMIALIAAASVLIILMGVMMGVTLAISRWVDSTQAKDLVRASSFFWALGGVTAIMAACVAGLVALAKWTDLGTVAACAGLVAGLTAVLGGVAVLIAQFAGKADIGKSAAIIGLVAGLFAVIVGVSALALYLLKDADPGQLIAVAGVFIAFIAALTLIVIALGALAIVADYFAIKTLPLILLGIAAIFASFAIIGFSIWAILEGIASVIDAISGLFEAIIEFSQADVSGFGENLKIIVQGIKDVIPLIGEALGEFVALLPNIFINAAISIVQGFGALLGVINEFIAGPFTEFVNNVLPLFANILLNAIIFIMDFIIENVDMVIKKIVEFANTIANAIRKNDQDIVDAFFNVWDAIAGLIAKWYPEMKERGKELLEKLKSGIGEKVGSVVREIISLGAKMVNTIKEKLMDFYNIGRNLISKIKDGINSAKDSLINTIRGLAGGMVGKLMDELDEHSPSKETEEIGKNFVEGLKNGISEFAGSAIDDIKAWGSDMLSGLKDQFSSGDGSLFSGLTDGLKDKFSLDNLGLGDLGLTTSLTPVLDTSSFGIDTSSLSSSFNAGSLGLSDLNSTFTSSPSLENIQNSTFDDTNIVNELTSLRQEVTLLGERISEMQIVMDTDALVGSIAGPMDNALGRMAVMRERGGY